jgi:hypothetical protein
MNKLVLKIIIWEILYNLHMVIPRLGPTIYIMKLNFYIISEIAKNQILQ